MRIFLEIVKADGLVVSSKTIDNCNNLSAEFWGVLISLEFSWKKKFKKVIVQVDNKVVVDSLDVSNLILMQGLSFARRILLLTKKFKDLHFKHIYKEC